MSFRSGLLISFFLAVLGIESASADQTGALMVFLASDGSDGTLCTGNQPCQSMSYALQHVASGGTIICRDLPPYFPSMTISISVTIKCPGLVFGNITINLPNSETKQSVHIEGLTVNTFDDFGPAVSIVSAGAVVLQDLIIRQATTQGIADRRTSPGKLLIKDSIIEKNPGPGVLIAGAASNTAVLENVTLSENVYGVAVASGNRVSINHSTISGNTTAGVEADGGSLVIVDGSTIANNNIGVQSGSAVRLSNNDIQFNTTGVSGATGTYGNNRFAGNGSDGTALTPVGAGSTDLAQK